MYKLYAHRGWGSLLAEAQLAWYGLPFTIEEVDNLLDSADARAALAPVNPVSQIPTLILPDSSIMTESAAITLYLADVTGSTALVPAPQEPERPRFLRWLIFLVANVYPTFTYADRPARFVLVDAAQEPFKDAVDAYAQKLWATLEQEAGSPWFLGTRFSALDIYLAVMTRWRPRRAWFAEHRPRLHDIALRAEKRPELAAAWERNFPPAAA